MDELKDQSVKVYFYTRTKELIREESISTEELRGKPEKEVTLQTSWRSSEVKEYLQRRAGGPARGVYIGEMEFQSGMGVYIDQLKGVTWKEVHL